MEPLVPFRLAPAFDLSHQCDVRRGEKEVFWRSCSEIVSTKKPGPGSTEATTIDPQEKSERLVYQSVFTQEYS